MTARFNRQFAKYLTRVHKWTGLILAVQIVLWFGSGFFMTLFPINDVRGRHIAQDVQLSLSDKSLMPIEIAMTAYDGTLDGAQLVSIAGQPAYILSGDSGDQILNAKTGQAVLSLREAQIRDMAGRFYKGEGQLVSLLKLSETTREYQGPRPVWQAQYDDSAKTRLYINAQTGQLASVRTRLWRVFDFMWRLHIMDITGEDSFNTWWLRLASFLAFLFSLTGVGLLWHRFAGRPKKRRQAV